MPEDDLPGAAPADAPASRSPARPGAPSRAAAGRRVRLSRRFYERDALELAPLLLGKLVVTLDGRAGRVIEAEAYRGADDPASHAFRGRTARNATMFGAPGLLYVYLSYGMHHCANVVGGTAGQAQAVLLRALEPVAGLEAMRQARWGPGAVRGPDRDLCRGPARLCQALGIDRTFDGVDLVTGAGGVWLADDRMEPPAPAVSRRIGLTKAAELPWRFAVPDHPGVSGRR